MKTHLARVRITTPLTVGTAIVVAVLGSVMILIEPEDLWAWLIAILFLPTAMLGLTLISVLGGSSDKSAPKVAGGLRAALVGAGVLLATALGFSITENLGLTGSEGQFTAAPILTVLVALVAVFIDVAGARLEQAAAHDQKSETESGQS